MSFDTAQRPPARAARSPLRDRILECFAEQVAKNGYSATSISEVARLVGTSKGTVVHHFGTKEKMLVELEMSFMTRREAEADAIQLWYEDPLDQLVATMYALLRVHRDERVLSRVFMREFIMLVDSPAMRPVREIRDRYQARLSEMIRRAMQQGSLGQGDVTLLTLQIFGMCNHPWTWYRPGGPHSLHTIAESFVTSLLKGITASDLSPPDRVTSVLTDVETRLGHLHEPA
jgi:AcrR family transcriptional regulator